jgi:hypothetical protein
MPTWTMTVLAVLGLALAACGQPVELTAPPRTPTPAEVALAPDCADLEPEPVDQPAPSPLSTPALLPVHLEEISAWVEREASEHLAGMWIEQPEGVATLAFTEDVERYRAAVGERFGPDVRVVAADHTFAELEAVVARVSELMGERAGPGDPEPGAITSVGIRPSLNRAIVGVLGDSAQARAELSERFGADVICFEVEPIPTAEHARPAPWQPADRAALTPQTTAIDVLVVEQACASGEAATGRITEPEIAYRDDAVVITLRVIPPAGGQTCPGNPDTPFTVKLDEPLGDRELFDGRTDPPSTPDLTGHR